MLEEQDFKRIGEELGKVIEQNIIPVLDSLDKRLTKVESNMVTKDDLSRGLANLKGDINIKLRQEDKKVNILIEHHIEKNLLKNEDIQTLRQIEVFPQI